MLNWIISRKGLPFTVDEQLVGPAETILDAALIDVHSVDVLSEQKQKQKQII
jgi:hypothetical protein